MKGSARVEARWDGRSWEAPVGPTRKADEGGEWSTPLMSSGRGTLKANNNAAGRSYSCGRKSETQLRYCHSSTALVLSPMWQEEVEYILYEPIK